MYLIVGEVISAEEVRAARQVLDTAVFKDGRATAGWHAKEVKHNLQASSGDKAVVDLRAELTKKIEGNTLFRMFVRPRKLTPLILSRYEVGMEYGTHVDDAIISGIRTDLSFTLFLEDPETYDGGALIIETTGGTEEIKLPAGSMVIYPSSTLHRVEPISRGVRRAAVGWACSYLRSAEQREILFDLDMTVEEMRRAKTDRSILDKVVKTRSNLLRQWVDI